MVKNIMNKTLSGYSFSTHHDHSKWAIGVQADWMCISDLNRMVMNECSKLFINAENKDIKAYGKAVFNFRNTRKYVAEQRSALRIQLCGKISTVGYSRWNHVLLEGGLC